MYWDRTSTTFVKKKAALTLLRLYRKHPSVLDANDWAERIIAMMGDPDPAVALTMASLVTAMAQDNLDAFRGCYQKALKWLDMVRSSLSGLQTILTHTADCLRRRLSPGIHIL